MTTRELPAINSSAASASRAIGAIFFVVNGGAWLVVGVLKGYGLSLVALLTILAVTLLLFLIALRKFRENRGAHAAEANSPESKRSERIFDVVNAIQWSVVFFASIVLIILRHPEWIIPSIILIVGIHFFPLAIAFKVPRHYGTGAAMILLAVVYPFLSNAGPAVH
jgi:archaellum biogenesis protein FlaJ (TadC family)